MDQMIEIGSETGWRIIDGRMRDSNCGGIKYGYSVMSKYPMSFKYPNISYQKTNEILQVGSFKVCPFY